MEEKKLSPERLELLHKLRREMAWCCNDFIQNYGPGGVYEGQGRSFEYPVTFKKNGERVRFLSPNDRENAEIVLSGVCLFGANQLPIYRNLNDILLYLEKNYDLKIPQ